MGVNKILQALLIVLSAAALTACATPNVSEPISRFATASQAASDAIDIHNTAVTDYIQNTSRTAAVGTPVGVRLAQEEEEKDCLSDSSRCRIVLYRTKDDKDAKLSEPLTDHLALQQIPKLMALISAYANNLAALANADSTESIRGSLDATAGSIANIAETISPGSGTRAAEIAAPIAGAVSWATGRYLANLKKEGLMHATTAADPLVTQAASILKEAETELTSAASALLAEDISMKMDVFRDASNRSNLDQLIAAADAYDGFLQSSTDSVFDAMANAHTRITTAFSSESMSFGEALGEIQFFLAQAVELREIGEQLATALNSGD